MQALTRTATPDSAAAGTTMWLDAVTDLTPDPAERVNI
jgi:hypothetical protein